MLTCGISLMQLLSTKSSVKLFNVPITSGIRSKALAPMSKRCNLVSRLMAVGSVSRVFSRISSFFRLRRFPKLEGNASSPVSFSKSSSKFAQLQIDFGKVFKSLRPRFKYLRFLQFLIESGNDEMAKNKIKKRLLERDRRFSKHSASIQMSELCK